MLLSGLWLWPWQIASKTVVSVWWSVSDTAAAGGGDDDDDDDDDDDHADLVTMDWSG